MASKKRKNARLPKERKPNRGIVAPRATVGLRVDLLDYEQAAAFLGIRRSTLQCWVSSGLYGIPFIKLGALVRFRPAALMKWIESRERGGRMSVSTPSTSGLEAR